MSPSPKQWPGLSLHKICKVYNEKYFGNNADVDLVVFKIIF